MIDLLCVGGRVVRCRDVQGGGGGDLTERDEAIGVHEGRIAYLGPRSEAPEANALHDFKGLLVLPGLVDPHTHLVFAGSRADEFARRMSGVDYHTIAAEGGGIASTVRATRNASDEELYALARARAEALREHGVTAVEIKSGYGLNTEHELRLLRTARALERDGVVRVTTSFLGAHAVSPEMKGNRTRYVDSVLHEQLPAVVDEGLADTIDVYCDEGAFTLDEARRILGAGRGAGLRVRAHVGQFADLGGAELAAELGALSADHLEQVSDEGLEAMASAGTVAVFLPGAWRTLRQTPPSAQRFREHGVTMAIGTDLNPGTSPTSDLILCASLAVRDAGMTSDEAIRGITENAARAAGFSDAGTIRLGQPADLAVFAVQSIHSLTYAIGGMRAAQVMRAGHIVETGGSRSLW